MTATTERIVIWLMRGWRFDMFAELSTTSITKAKSPQMLEENMRCAADGGDMARVVRENIDKE